MTEFLTSNHLFGLTLGVATFLIIGLFHPIVIKTEYYFGKKTWPAFLIAGIALCIVSWMVNDTFWSTLAGVTAFSSFWSIGELFEQEKRVARGWFPENPNKHKTK